MNQQRERRYRAVPKPKKGEEEKKEEKRGMFESFDSNQITPGTSK